MRALFAFDAVCTALPNSENAVACSQPMAMRSTLGIDDVAFGILTSERFLETRLASQQRTWLRHVRHVVFYSESVRMQPKPST